MMTNSNVKQNSKNCSHTKGANLCKIKCKIGNIVNITAFSVHGTRGTLAVIKFSYQIRFFKSLE